MQVELFNEFSGKLPDNHLSWIFGNQDNPPVLMYWSQFVTLISQCSTGVWMDGKDFNQRVCVNDLQELYVEDDDEKIFSSFDKGDCDVEQSDGNDTVDINKDDKQLEMSRLTQELYSLIFQRNQLIKKMQHLQDLANIDLDVFSLILDVDINPEGKTELNKVSKLVQTVMNDTEICRGYDDIPLKRKEYWDQVENDNPVQMKPPSFPKYSSRPQDMSEIIRVNPIIRKINEECNQSVNSTENDDHDDHADLQKPGNNNDDDYLMPSYACEFCGKTFVKPVSLRLHMWMKHGQKLPKDCKICGKVFRHSNRLDSHMYNHTEEKHLQCSLCGKTFKWQRSFDRHCKSVHSERKPFSCSVCKKGFKQKCHMLSHEKLHTKTNRDSSECERGPDGLYRCKICDKGFHIPSRLKFHMVLHSEEKLFQCTVCNKSFKRKDYLNKHKKIFHSEKRPFQCSLCPKRFKQNGNMRDHEMGHTQREPFKCSLCDKTFKLFRSLRKHQVIVHSDEMPDNQGHQQEINEVTAPGPDILGRTPDDRWYLLSSTSTNHLIDIN